VLIVFSLCVFLVLLFQDGSCDGSSSTLEGASASRARNYRGSEKLGVVDADYDLESAPSPAPSEQGLQRFD